MSHCFRLLCPNHFYLPLSVYFISVLCFALPSLLSSFRLISVSLFREFFHSVLLLFKLVFFPSFLYSCRSLLRSYKVVWSSRIVLGAENTRWDFYPANRPCLFTVTQKLPWQQVGKRQLRIPAVAHWESLLSWQWCSFSRASITFLQADLSCEVCLCLT